MVHRPNHHPCRGRRRRRAGADRSGARRRLAPRHAESLSSRQPQPRRTLPMVPPPSAADMLRGMAEAGGSADITIDEILTALGNHGFGLLILVLALPNAIPGPIIPGFSVPFALGIILLSLQILQGHR